MENLEEIFPRYIHASTAKDLRSFYAFHVKIFYYNYKTLQCLSKMYLQNLQFIIVHLTYLFINKKYSYDIEL